MLLHHLLDLFFNLFARFASREFSRGTRLERTTAEKLGHPPPPHQLVTFLEDVEQADSHYPAFGLCLCDIRLVGFSPFGVTDVLQVCLCRLVLQPF